MPDRAVAGRAPALDVSAEVARIRAMDDPPAMLRAYGALETRLRAEGGTLVAGGVSTILAAIVAAADKQRGGNDARAVSAELAEERRRRELAELHAADAARALAIVMLRGRWRWRCRRWLLGDARAELALPPDLRRGRVEHPRRGRWPEAAGAVLALAVAVAAWSRWSAPVQPAAGVARVAAPHGEPPATFSARRAADGG